MQFLLPEEHERAKENIKNLLAGGKYAPDEYKFVRKNGTYFPALITAMPRICSTTKLLALEDLFWIFLNARKEKNN